MILGLALALLTAVSNAASNVLQRIANQDEPDGRGAPLALIRDLLHKKVWLAGFGAIIASFFLQAGALRYGTLALVQPIVVLELPLTLLLGSRVLRVPLHRREWTSLGAMTAGIGILLAALAPSSGTDHASATAWIVGGGTCTAAITGLMACGRLARSPARAGLYGGATGIAFGLTAAFTTTAVGALSGGLGAFFTTWQTYAMAVAGLAAMYMTQLALQAGRLIAAQPGITLLDPVTSILWGTLAFGEQTQEGPWLIAAVAGGLLMIAGAVLLSRSPLLEEAAGEGVDAGGSEVRTAASG